MSQTPSGSLGTDSNVIGGFDQGLAGDIVKSRMRDPFQEVVQLLEIHAGVAESP
jgi:hypothetical protein